MALSFLAYLQASVSNTIHDIGETSTVLPYASTSATAIISPCHNATDRPELHGTPCLGIFDVFIALFLVLLIFTTVIGNLLVVLSVFVYKRMRTFTNILLTSLAIADLLVGLLVMPLSLMNLLHKNRWPFGDWLCRMWATCDTLLCTASILNLCAISLDRYMAITSPLKYPRSRSRFMAAVILAAVWLISALICSPPFFYEAWKIHKVTREHDACEYPNALPYRIYSAFGSFFVPLMVMLVVYLKIYRVASEREKLMRQSVGTCRLSNRIVKTQAKNNRHNPRNGNGAHGDVDIAHAMTHATSGAGPRGTTVRYRHTGADCTRHMLLRPPSEELPSPRSLGEEEIRECASAPIAHKRMQAGGGSGVRANYSMRPTSNCTSRIGTTRMDSSEAEDSPPAHDSGDMSQFNSASNGALPHGREAAEGHETSEAASTSGVRSMERECHSLADLADKNLDNGPRRKNTEVRTESAQSSAQRRPQTTTTRLQPQNLMAKAHEHYQMCGPGKAVRGSKEKMVYLRERKALKTIGIVVLGFIICWMPFFITYLLEVSIRSWKEGQSTLYQSASIVFLWLGYSNSVLNPIIYTMYNGDFRRCFRDLVSLGCVQHHRRTMSVKKLHQQSTIF